MVLAGNDVVWPCQRPAQLRHVRVRAVAAAAGLMHVVWCGGNPYGRESREKVRTLIGSVCCRGLVAGEARWCPVGACCGGGLRVHSGWTVGVVHSVCSAAS